MKLLHVSVQIQYTDLVEAILAAEGLGVWARYGRIAGRDSAGRHEGSQAFPGNLTVIQAQVPDEWVDDVLAALEDFRLDREAHRHLEALVLPVERRIGSGEASGSDPDEDSGAREDGSS